MAEEKQEKSKTNLTKFPNAEKANQEAPLGLPSAFDLFKPSVRILQNNLVGFLVLLGIPALLALIGQGPDLFKPAADSPLIPDAPFSGFLFLGWLASLLAGPGVILLQLKGTRRENLTWQDAFSQGLRRVPAILGLGILLSISLAVSAALLLVPFFFVLPRLFMAPYYLIDQNMGVVEAMKASWKGYQPHKGIWGVIGVGILLAMASIIPLIGWLVAVVLSFLYSAAPAIRYEQLKNLAADKPARTPVEVDAEL